MFEKSIKQCHYYSLGYKKYKAILIIRIFSSLLSYQPETLWFFFEFGINWQTNFVMWWNLDWTEISDLSVGELWWKYQVNKIEDKNFPWEEMCFTHKNCRIDKSLD